MLQRYVEMEVLEPAQSCDGVMVEIGIRFNGQSEVCQRPCLGRVESIEEGPQSVYVVDPKGRANVVERDLMKGLECCFVVDLATDLEEAQRERVCSGLLRLVEQTVPVRLHVMRKTLVTIVVWPTGSDDRLGRWAVECFRALASAELVARLFVVQR